MHAIFFSSLFYQSLKYGIHLKQWSCRWADHDSQDKTLITKSSTPHKILVAFKGKIFLHQLVKSRGILSRLSAIKFGLVKERIHIGRLFYLILFTFVAAATASTITMPPKRGRTGPTAVPGTPALKRAKTEKIVLAPKEQQIFKRCVFCKLISETTK